MSKRIFDLIASFLGLVILSPLIICISVLIKLTSRGPVFFKQDRIGKDEKIFKIYKFRTMGRKSEKLGPRFTTPKNDPRITKIGRFLRRFNIDEVPQLFNVIRGEMSIVGPRPEVPEMLLFYTDEQKKVLSVRPGMTDLASLRFRKEGEIMEKSNDFKKTYVEYIMPEKLNLNLKYINERSFWFDFKIIFQTIASIIFNK